MEELTQSNFISLYLPFGKRKKEKLYRLTDEYSLFFLQFIEKNLDEGPDTWQLISQTQAYKTWSGYAFENICLKHVTALKKGLGISGIYSTSSSYYKKGTEYEKGIQIDLLIDRNDNVINICEIKFYQEPFSISKSYAEKLRLKMGIFKQATGSRKHLILTFISTFGVQNNAHSASLNIQSLTLDNLFD